MVMKSSLAPLFTNTLLCVRGGEWFEQQSAKTSQPCIIPYSTENAWFVRHDYGTHAVSLWYIIMSYPFRSNISMACPETRDGRILMAITIFKATIGRGLSNPYLRYIKEQTSSRCVYYTRITYSTGLGRIERKLAL